MLSNQTPFTDMLNQENLQRMSINRALIPVFANVMKKWQVHFEKKGYLGANNYALLLEDVLLKDGNSKFSIDFQEITKGVAGRFVKSENLIAINHDVREISFAEKESILSHELLHLITLTYFYDKQNENSYKQDYRKDSLLHVSSFLREGYTEGLNKRIYKDSNVYVPHVKMVEYLNYILGKEENFYTFLNGYTGLENTNLDKFIQLTNNYHNNFYGTGYEIGEAIKDKDYVVGQNYLVAHFANIIGEDIKSQKFVDVNDYISRIYKIKELAPVKNEFLNLAITRMHTNFIENHYSDLNLTSNEVEKYVDLLNNYMAEKVKYEEGYLHSVKVSSSVLDVLVDVYQDKFRFRMGAESIILSRNTPFNYAQNLVSSNNEKDKSVFTMYINYDSTNEKLNLEYSFPIFSKAKVNLNEVDSVAIMQKRKETLDNLYAEFDDLNKKRNEIKDFYDMFSLSKRVKEICFENPKRKYILEEDKYGSVKVWYDAKNKSGFSEIKDISSKLKTKKVSKPKGFGLIPNFGYTYTGCELIVNNNEKIFIYLTDKKELSVAKVNQDDRLEFPDSMTEINQPKPTKNIDDKTL